MSNAATPVHHRTDGEEPLWTTEQGARFCNESKSTWDKRRLAGEGPPFLKLGRSVRYRPSDVRDWMKSQLRRSTSQRPEAMGAQR